MQYPLVLLPFTKFFHSFSYQSPTKKEHSENNLLPITDRSIPTKPSDEDLKSEKFDKQQPEVKTSGTISSNVPATVSSVDQIGVSSVDLNIAEAVEKGISDVKKEDPSIPPDVSKVPKDEVGKDVQTISKCSECENEKAPIDEKIQDASPNEIVSKVQKGKCIAYVCL